ncbi:MAG: PilW family protein [Planctomycetota bacterium]
MTSAMKEAKRPHNSTALRPAFTLVELTASMAVMSVLMIGMASAMMIASSALPEDDNVTSLRRQAINVMDDLTTELRYTVFVETADPNNIQFHVADRGHGDPADEVINYSWDGNPGSSLQYDYNGSTRTLLASIQDFSLTYQMTIGELTNRPKVLMVVADSANLSDQDLARKTLLDKYGFPVQVIDDSAPDADFATAATLNDVIYVAAGTDSSLIGTALNALTIGKVLELTDMYPILDISLQSRNENSDWIDVQDNTHPITKGLPIGAATICKSVQQLEMTWGEFAPDMQVLAHSAQDGSSGPNLVTVEIGGSLLNGNFAAGRLVTLPWSGGIDFNTLNGTGQMIFQRSLAWAATPIVRQSVHVVLQTDGDPVSRLDFDVKLLNEPEM